MDFNCSCTIYSGINLRNNGSKLIFNSFLILKAARLSKACNLLRIVGQEVRTRPFVHQDTPSYELDSILLYTSSLKLNAKLYHLPITTKYLYLIFTLSAILLLVLGQLHYLMPKQ